LKLSTFAPFLTASKIQFGLRLRPVHVCDGSFGLRYCAPLRLALYRPPVRLCYRGRPCGATLGTWPTELGDTYSTDEPEADANGDSDDERADENQAVPDPAYQAAALRLTP
jgi:hypothetical protein